MSQQLRKIRGRSLDEAYRAMRGKYGPDAIVISTEQVRKGGLFGLLGRKCVEITASVPQDTTPPPRTSGRAVRSYSEQAAHGQGEQRDTIEYFERLVRDAQQRMNRPGSDTEKPEAARVAGAGPVVPFPKPQAARAPYALQRDLQELREMVQVLYAEHPGAGLPSEFAPHYRQLVERGVTRKAAAALLGAVVKNSDLRIIRDPRVFVERLQLELRKGIRTTGGIALQGGECRVVAFCGATGVGKTTNLAKVAAHFAVHERARVAMVTADIYRVAAPEQLRVYANIIGIPLRVVDDASAMSAAIRDLRHYDLVLIDSAGGSQFNLEQISELKAILHAASPHETHLVLAANTHYEDLQNVISNFKCLNPTSVFFTKLDETRHYGALYSALTDAALPLSYLGVGQNVPDDLRVATPALVAQFIMEGKDSRG